MSTSAHSMPHPTVRLPPQALFTISLVLGAVACGSSLLLLWCALDSWNTSGLFARWGLPPMPYGKITTLIYLKVRHHGS